MVSTARVRIDAIQPDPRGARQDAGRRRTTVPLADQADSIREAVRQSAQLMQNATEGLSASSSVEAVFGIAVSDTGATVVSKASADATYEVKIVVGATGRSALRRRR